MRVAPRWAVFLACLAGLTAGCSESGGGGGGTRLKLGAYTTPREAYRGLRRATPQSEHRERPGRPPKTS